MIKALPPLRIKPLSSISPSQFSRLEGCALQVVIQKSQSEELLPPGPMTYFGTATHKLLELAAKGKLTDEPALKDHFDQLIAQAEASLLAKGWAHLVPLPSQITDYALRRRQVIKRALLLVTPNALTTGFAGSLYQAEERFESANKQVMGYIDAIRQGPDGPEIVDYKSGQILDETGLVVKPAYRQQLLLYAYLYWERHNIWPVRLQLVGLTGPPHNVPYTPDEAQRTYQRAVSWFGQANVHVQAGDLSALSAGANPADCPTCPVRMLCPSHTITPTAKGFTDVAGVIALVHELPRGIRIDIVSNGQTHTVLDVPSAHLLTLTALFDRPVRLLNVRVVGTFRYEWRAGSVLFYP